MTRTSCPTYVPRSNLNDWATSQERKYYAQGKSQNVLFSALMNSSDTSKLIYNFKFFINQKIDRDMSIFHISFLAELEDYPDYFGH